MNTLDLDIVQGIGGHVSPCDFLQAVNSKNRQCCPLSLLQQEMLIDAVTHALPPDDLQPLPTVICQLLWKPCCI